MPSRKTPPSTTTFVCVGGGPIDGVFIDIGGADPRKPFVYTAPGTGTRSVYSLVSANGGPPQLLFVGHPAALKAAR